MFDTENKDSAARDFNASTNNNTYFITIDISFFLKLSLNVHAKFIKLTHS